MIATKVSFFLLIVSLCRASGRYNKEINCRYAGALCASCIHCGPFSNECWVVYASNLHSKVGIRTPQSFRSVYWKCKQLEKWIWFQSFHYLLWIETISTVKCLLIPYKDITTFVETNKEVGGISIRSQHNRMKQGRSRLVTIHLYLIRGVYGDMGVYYSDDTIDRVTKRVQSNEFDWIFHVGDISYADIHILSFQETWNTWFERMENVTSKVPYMVGPGNHEYVSYNPFLYLATRNFVPYNHRFSMPHANEESLSMYYSFDYGNVHWISYSTETSFPDAPYGEANNFGDQLKWLKADLEKANLPENRKKQPWIIVSGYSYDIVNIRHRPIYSSSYGYSRGGVPINSFIPPSNSLTLQKTFEDLFMKYQVDVIFNGHVHSYERNYPAYRNKKVSEYVNPKAPVSIVVGCAGNIEGLEGPNERNCNFFSSVLLKGDQPQPEWSAFRFGKGYGYGALTVSNATHLHWKFYQASNDSLTDEIVVTKMPMYK